MYSVIFIKVSFAEIIDLVYESSICLGDKHHAVDLYASMTRGKIQEKSERPEARQEKERITSGEEKGEENEQ